MPQFGIRFTLWGNAHPRDGEKPLPYEEWQNTDYVFSTFDEAKAFAAREEDYGTRQRWCEELQTYERRPTYAYRAFKLPEDMDYTVREPALIAKGEYEPLPEKMWPDCYEFVFPRLIDEKGTKFIGYYESEMDAKYKRLKKVKPTKYFAWAFGSDSDQLWDYMTELGLIADEVGFKLLTSREDIRYAYENGPESCMAGEASSYHDTHVHPVEAYASPDLALAIAYRGEDWKENIVARTIVNVNNKGYVRIYGDKKRMEKLMEEAGYTENSYCLGGARLLKIYGKNESGTELSNIIMVPYLDGACTEVELPDVNGEFMNIIQQPIRFCGSTQGYYRI